MMENSECALIDRSLVLSLQRNMNRKRTIEIIAFIGCNFDSLPQMEDKTDAGENTSF